MEVTCELTVCAQPTAGTRHAAEAPLHQLAARVLAAHVLQLESSVNVTRAMRPLAEATRLRRTSALCHGPCGDALDGICIIFTSFSPHFHFIFTQFSINFHFIFTIFSHNFHFIFTSFSHYVHSIFTPFSSHFQFIFTQFSLHFHFIFTPFSFHFHPIFSPFPHHFHTIFTPSRPARGRYRPLVQCAAGSFTQH